MEVDWVAACRQTKLMQMKGRNIPNLVQGSFIPWVRKRGLLVGFLADKLLIFESHSCPSSRVYIFHLAVYFASDCILQQTVIHALLFPTWNC